MKLVATLSEEHDIRFAIESDTLTDTRNGDKQTAYNIFRYERGRTTHDYVQNDLETALSFSLVTFGIPLTAWTQVED